MPNDHDQPTAVPPADFDEPIPDTLRMITPEDALVYLACAWLKAEAQEVTR